MTTNESGTIARNKMMDDFKTLINDAEELLRNTEQQAGEGFKLARTKFESTLESAKGELNHLEQVVVDTAKEAASTTEEYVKDHPWKSVGLGACVGVIFGLLIGRK